MAVLPLGAKNSKKVTTNPSHVQCQKKKKKKVERDDERPAPPPWGSTLKSLFSCKHHQTVRVDEGEKIKRLSRIGCSGALCSLKRDQRESSSKVVQRPDEPNSPDSFKNGGSSNNSISNSNSSSNRFSKAPSSGDMSGPLTTLSSSLISHSSASITAASTSSSSSSSSLGNGGNGGSSLRGMQHLRRFSAAGCYECHAVVDPITGVVVSRVVPSFRRSNYVIFTCSHCGEIFTKCDTLELHQAIKHAGVLY